MCARTEGPRNQLASDSSSCSVIHSQQEGGGASASVNQGGQCRSWPSQATRGATHTPRARRSRMDTSTRASSAAPCPIQCALSRLTNRVWARHATDSRHRKQCMLLPNRRQMMKLKTSWTKRPELQDSSTQLRIGARYALNCLCPGVVARGWESRLMLCGLAAGDFHPVG